MLDEKLNAAFQELGFISIPLIYDHVAEEASKESIPYLEFLDKILRGEIEARNERAVKTNMKLAKFPYIKFMEEFDFEFQPSADKRRMEELMTLRFAEKKENIIFLGPPGVGKTHLGIALAVEAVRKRYTAYFVSSHELIMMIKENIRNGRINRKIKTLQKPDILVIDEVGYTKMDAEVAHYFF